MISSDLENAKSMIMKYEALKYEIDEIAQKMATNNDIKSLN